MNKSVAKSRAHHTLAVGYDDSQSGSTAEFLGENEPSANRDSARAYRTVFSALHTGRIYRPMCVRAYVACFAAVVVVVISHTLNESTRTDLSEKKILLYEYGVCFVGPNQCVAAISLTRPTFLLLRNHHLSVRPINALFVLISDTHGTIVFVWNVLCRFVFLDVFNFGCARDCLASNLTLAFRTTFVAYRTIPEMLPTFASCDICCQHLFL